MAKQIINGCIPFNTLFNSRALKNLSFLGIVTNYLIELLTVRTYPWQIKASPHPCQYLNGACCNYNKYVCITTQPAIPNP